jgi:hypothetical protein
MTFLFNLLNQPLGLLRPFGITQFSISAHLNTIGNLFDEGVMANNDPYNNSSGYTPLVVYSSEKKDKD